MNGTTPKSAGNVFIALISAALLVFQCGGRDPARSADINWYTSNPAADTFTISTAAELSGLAALVNREDSAISFAQKTITLTADIDLSTHYGKTYNNKKGWIPIGKDSVNRFCGVFDGNRKAISGLYISGIALAAAGLFGVIGSGGMVVNLGIVNADIRGGDNVGAVAGWVDGDADTDRRFDIAECYSTGQVRGKNRVGGVVGFVGRGGVGNCYSFASVGGYCCVGGVAGHVDGGGRLFSCYSTGAVRGDFSCVGGVVGELRDGRVTFCAALNPSVTLLNTELPNSGRVVGKLGSENIKLFDNVAFDGILNAGGGASDWANIGADAKDGNGIAAAEIRADGTVGGIFTGVNWATEFGQLPGFGAAVGVPIHLSGL